MTRTFKKTLLIALLLGISILSKSEDNPQPQMGNDNQQTEKSGNPLGGAPLGGGISILITLGIAVGMRRLLDAKKSTEDIT